MQGYAYILTHPGTPSVFYDHIFSHYNSQISTLISIRNRNKIHCRSMVSIIIFVFFVRLDVGVVWDDWNGMVDSIGMN